jgi:hypothetical protein
LKYFEFIIIITKFFIIRIESLNVNGRTTLGQSISVNNDDNGQITNDTTDTDDINDKNTILNHEEINKTSSNSNVFSRIMHSEPACSI